MIGSSKLAQLFLRLGLVAVFLWFGIDKFLHPNYWINAWMPLWFIEVLNGIGLSSLNFIYLLGIFEVIVAISFLSDFMIRLFAFLTAVFLILTIIFSGINEVIVRDFGLIGAVLALFVWPKRFYR